MVREVIRDGPDGHPRTYAEPRLDLEGCEIPEPPTVRWDCEGCDESFAGAWGWRYDYERLHGAPAWLCPKCYREWIEERLGI